jgi:hypothetical protein
VKKSISRRARRKRRGKQKEKRVSRKGARLAKVDGKINHDEESGDKGHRVRFREMKSGQVMQKKETGDSNKRKKGETRVRSP